MNSIELKWEFLGKTNWGEACNAVYGGVGFGGARCLILHCLFFRTSLTTLEQVVMKLPSKNKATLTASLSLFFFV
jgi:hypothetical protein